MSKSFNTRISFSCYCNQSIIKAKMISDKRVTMIKPVVGKVKCPSYALPDNDFVYGIESKLDKENAGEGKMILLSFVCVCTVLSRLSLNSHIPLVVYCSCSKLEDCITK